MFPGNDNDHFDLDHLDRAATKELSAYSTLSLRLGFSQRCSSP